MAFFNGNFNILYTLNLITTSYVVLFAFSPGIALGFGLPGADRSIAV